MKNKKPEIRFKGFSEEWEEKELGVEVKITMGQSPNGENYTNNPENSILVQGNADMKNGKVVPRVWTKQITKTANSNDLIFSVRAPVGEVGKTDYDVVIGRGVAAIEGNEFIFQSLIKKNENGYWNQFSAGSTFDSINSNDLSKAIISTTSKTEQTQIGNFFKNLDNLITLHQRKYEKLEILKKAMLEKMFPKNGADVPEIRFKGFEGAWEEKDLGDVAEIKTGPFGSTLHAEDYVEDGEPIITTEHFKSGILPNYKKGIPQVSNFDYSRLKSYLLKSGDIVFSRVGSVDINAHIKHFQDGWLFSGRVLRVRTTESIDSEFLHQELSTTRVRNNVIMRAVGQTMPSINTQILKATQVRIPRGINEQKRIGVFFINLDNLLTLHQGELTKLKNLKKAMLEKMFV